MNPICHDDDEENPMRDDHLSDDEHDGQCLDDGIEYDDASIMNRGGGTSYQSDLYDVD